MDTPLPLPQVQKIAGHKDIGTTMRYVHVDGIENTGSRQWSREKRRSLQETKDQPVAIAAPVPFEVEKPVQEPVPIRYLRLVNSPAN